MSKDILRRESSPMSCRSCPGGSMCRCRDPTSFASINDRIRRKYHELTTKQLELPMSSNKSFLDSMFDTADAALGVVEKTLTPAQPTASEKQSSQPIIDAEFEEAVTPSDEDRLKEWEDTWAKEYHWAIAGVPNSLGEAHHMFAEASLRAICGANFKSNEVCDRQKLVHGKKIVACTSCIIAAARKS